EFRNSQLLDSDPASDIEVVRSIQDTINLVWAYMLNALDYATLPQRVAMADSPTEPILDEETGEEIGDRPVELDRLIKERILEFRNSQLLDSDPASDIEVVRSIQDTINLVWAYMLNALDYATLPQRVAMADSPTEPILDEETGEEIGDRPVELDRLIKERIM